MATNCYAQVRGRVIRVTKVDMCGDPIPGETAVAVSKRISSITIDEVTEEGTEIRERNFGDEICISDPAFTDVLGYTAEIALCGVDPNLITFMTGQPLVENAAGDVVGFDAQTGINLDDFGFSLEVWTRIAGSACDTSGNRQWGYTVFPFLKGGRLGGFSFENGAVQFTITGAQTRDGNGWGVGPFDVDRDETSAPAPLNTALASNTHYRNILVTLDPPEASCEPLELAAP